MAELLFHPAFGPAVADSRSRLADAMVDALDRAILAIECSGVAARSADLHSALCLCRTAREFLADVDRNAFGSSQRNLDALTKFMQDVRGLLLLVKSYQLSAPASA
jgi:hypothetical protein